MSDAILDVRRKYTPPIEALKPQGINRFLAEVHQNEDVKTKGGLYVPTLAQDYPTTGTVLAISDLWAKTEDGEEIYPDIQPGICVKVTVNGWSMFPIDGKMYAIGSAPNVIATYKSEDFCKE